MTEPNALPAPDQSEPSSEYSLWNDPDFWAVCEILADLCIESVRQSPALTDGQAHAIELGITKPAA